jgi:hypothetical protein
MYKLPSLLLFSDQQQYSIHAKKNNTPQKTKKRSPRRRKNEKKIKNAVHKKKKQKQIKISENENPCKDDYLKAIVPVARHSLLVFFS